MSTPTQTMPAEVIVDRVRRRFAVENIEVEALNIAAAIRSEPGASLLGEATLARITERLVAELAGAGPLSELLAERSVTDVLVNGSEVWVDRGYGLQRSTVQVGDDAEVRRLAQRLAAMGGRRLDDASPCVDAQLADGTRMHAVLPPVAQGGPYLSLRTLRQRGLSLADLVADGTMIGGVADLLASVVQARLPYLVTGGTGSGKTTLLSALLALVPPDERIVIVEDVAELRPRHPHVVALQSRYTNIEGVGEITMRELVRQAMRMRPDRLVIGECRGPEVVDLLAALNTGHEGSAATMHANATADVPARLEALGLLGGVPRPAMHAQVAAALRVVVHLTRSGRSRVVDEICLLRRAAGDLVEAVSAWRFDSGPGPGALGLAQLLQQRDVAVPAVLTIGGALR